MIDIRPITHLKPEDLQQLIGIALAEKQSWSNRLRLWEFHIAESHRGQGIGSQLMEALAQKGREAGLWVIFLRNPIHQCSSSALLPQT